MPTDWVIGERLYTMEQVNEMLEEAQKEMNRERLNTKQLINTLTGENKEFVERVEKQQESYGNYDVFTTTLTDYYVEIQLGEQWLSVYFDGLGNIQDTSGPAQGGRYTEGLLSCCVELNKIIRGEDL